MWRWTVAVAIGSFLSCIGCGQSRPAPNVGSATLAETASSHVQPTLAKAIVFLHNFQFEQAAESFREIEAADPEFALGYWGEALSYNHPLQRMQNLVEPRQVLERYGATPSTRLARAQTPIEKGLIESVDALFGDGDERARRDQYANVMSRLATSFPNNDDIQAFYVLSLLSDTQSGVSGSNENTARAQSIALQLFKRRPDHPGAAHYVIHAFDEPDGATAALPAARVYAKLAPDSPHALHMPSHAFIQLGLWDEVAESNAASYASAVRLLSQHTGSDAASYEADVNHALDWKQYANLQRGDYVAAWQDVDRARDLLRNSAAPRAIGVADLLRPRFVIESERWQDVDISPFAPADCWLAVGLGAARTGHLARAEEAASELGRLAAQSTAVVEVMHLEVQALSVHLKSPKEGATEAVAMMTRATDLDDRRGVPRGAPRPLKPPHELMGELLLQIGRPAEANREFAAALDRMPNRLRSVVGLARSSARSGDHEQARRMYEQLVSMWRGSDQDPLVTEARRYLGTP